MDEMIWAQAYQARAEIESIVNNAATDNEYLCRFCPHDEGLVTVDDNVYYSGTRVLNEDGLYTCITCGRTDWVYVSDEPEWNSGSGEGPDQSRVGAPVNTTLYSAAWGSGTIMSTKGATFANKRLARINFHTSMNHKDRSLHHAYDDLDRIGRVVLNLPETVMLQAKIMYRRFNEEKLTRGAIRIGIKANCVFRACRDANVSRTTQEIADAFGIPARDVSRTADMFRETIPEKPVASSVTKPSDLVARLFNDVTCIPDEERGRARQKVLQACRDHERNVLLMGKTPKGCSAAIMYVTLSQLGYAPNKEEIRTICDVSMPTLNKLEKIVLSATSASGSGSGTKPK
jgi:transcription initiation factor TFIIIB Brf1 subunit/transcription initiation factor TFIIB